jgi:hypothetical protein
MSTSSTIALEFADGTVGQVYAHWDGYLSHNGRILFENYQDPFKLRELIDLGSVSTLGKDIGVQHPFDNPGRYGDAEYTAHKEQYGHMCLFYGRDRGETGVEATYFKDFDDYVDNHQCEEYEYILRTDGKWYVCQTGHYYELLEDALKADEE